jgi:transcriptional regulator with XRE-family HTH domain
MNRFAQLRKEYGLTQRELAQLLGVARNTVARWEIGLVEPPKIAEVALRGLQSRLRKRANRDRHGS